MTEESRIQRREEVFSQAAEIADPEAREAFLAAECQGDAELRAAVDRLLQHDQDAGSFLEKSPAEFDALLPTHDSGSIGRDATAPEDAWIDLLEASERADAVGRLGSYDVLELVGRGGMGVVLRAFDPKLSRIVAIKLLAPEFAAQPTAVRRFLREARAAAAVSHDHVVSIYAIDDEARPPRITMELIDGQSLQHKIDSAGPLDVNSILRIGMQTAAGLGAAHRQGLVHRDIKPANILLENGIEKVKLTDFGLARAVDDIGMTKTGQITGTPQYMSPEQAQGQRVDHRTDLFSLGCVLYAMCTGRAAFRAESAVAVMHRIVHDTPRPIREVNPEIPDWLCGIVEKLLAKNPEERFESAAEVEELLGQCLVHLQQPTSVPLPEAVGQINRSAIPADKSQSANAGTSLRMIRPAEIGPATERSLRFVRNWLGLMGLLSLLWFFANLFVPYHGYLRFSFTMPTLLLSLVTGCLALCGAWHAMNRNSYGWTLVGLLAALLPVNGPQFLGFGLTVWALTRLWREEARAAFARETAAADEPQQPSPRAVRSRHWLRRMPAIAWILTALFTVVFLLAALDGAQMLDGRTAEVFGVLIYFLAVGCFTVWTAITIFTRRTAGTNGADAHQISPWPTALFFGTVTLISGAFLASWANFDFSNPMSFQQRIVEYQEGDDIAPWEDFRWDGDRAYAQIDDVWYEVLSIQQIPPADVLTIAASKFAAPRRMVVEQLVDVLIHMERYDGRHVWLSLRHVDRQDELTEYLNIEMTKTKRDALLRAMYPGGRRDDSIPTSETFVPPYDVTRRTVTRRPDQDVSPESSILPQVNLDQTWQINDWPILDLDISGDGHWLASVHRSPDGHQVWLWPLDEITEDDRTWSPKIAGGEVRDLQISPDNTRVAWVEADGRLQVRDLSRDDTSPAEFEPARSALHCVAWSATSQWIATGGDDVLTFWNADGGGSPLFSVPIPGASDGRITNLAWEPRRNRIAAGTDSGLIIVWEVLRSDVRLEREFAPITAGAVRSLTWSADRNWIVAGFERGSLEAFSLTESRQPGTGQSVGARRAVAFSPDSRWLASAGESAGNRHAISLDGLTQQPMPERRSLNDAHSKPVTGLAFAPDGQHLVSASEDGTIKWWEFAEPLAQKQNP